MNAIPGKAIEFRVRLWQKPAAGGGTPPLFCGEVDLLRACLGDFAPPLSPARLFLDGGRDRSRVARIRNGLRDLTDAEGKPCIQEIRLRDSKDSELLQAADLLAGLVTRSHLGRRDTGHLVPVLERLGEWKTWP